MKRVIIGVIGIAIILTVISIASNVGSGANDLAKYEPVEQFYLDAHNKKNYEQIVKMVSKSGLEYEEIEEGIIVTEPNNGDESVTVIYDEASGVKLIYEREDYVVENSMLYKYILSSGEEVVPTLTIEITEDGEETTSETREYGEPEYMIREVANEMQRARK